MGRQQPSRGTRLGREEAGRDLDAAQRLYWGIAAHGEPASALITQIALELPG